MLTRSFVIVLITVTINMMGVGLVWPTLPSLVEELTQSSISQTAVYYGSIAVIFSIMQFIFAPILGALSDRYGRRRVMLIALAALGFDNIFLALAPTVGWMFIGRALGGVFGATMSTANAYAADTTSEKDRAGAFGMIGAAFGVGFILGPLLGGILGDIDLRLPFYVAAALSFANVIFGYFFLEESLPEEKRTTNAVKFSNPFSKIGWLFSNRILLMLGMTVLMATTMQRGLEGVWVLFTQHQYGWGTKETGFSLAVVGISYIFVQGWLVRKVIPILGETTTIVAGFVLSAIMYVFLSFNTIGLFGYLGIIPHVVGWGCAQVAIQTICSKQVESNQQGLLQGALTSIGGLSAILGPAIATASFAYFTSPLAPVNFPGAFFALGAVVLVLAATLTLSAGRTTLRSCDKEQ